MCRTLSPPFPWHPEVFTLFQNSDEQKPNFLPSLWEIFFFFFYTYDQFPPLSARVTMKRIGFAQKAASPFSFVLVLLTCAFLQVFSVNTQLLLSLSCRAAALPGLYLLHCSTEAKLIQSHSVRHKTSSFSLPNRKIGDLRKHGRPERRRTIQRTHYIRNH